MSKMSLLRGGVFTVALLGLPLLGLQHWFLTSAVFVLMYAALSSSWNLVGGFAGYPSLGHAAFFGIGGYAIMIYFSNHPPVTGYEPFLVLPLVFILGAVVGIPIAWISMRTRADVFAIVTITFLFVIQVLAFNLHSLTGGSQGISLVPPFGPDHYELPFYYVMAIILLVTMLLTYFTMRSKFGLSLMSIRADEDKALGVGVRTTLVKVSAFSVSVGITAMLGGVYFYFINNIYPQFAVNPLVTIAMVLMTFLGGRATLWGPVLGAVILETAQQTLAYKYGADRLYLIIYACVFLVIMLLLPRGIVPTIEDKLRLRKRRIAADRGPIDGSPPSEAVAPDAIGAASGGVV